MDEKGHEAKGHAAVELAERIERERLAPVAGAAELVPRPFPAAVLWSLLAGVVLGGVVGLVFGWLLYRGSITVTGSEQLFSAGSFSFHTLWAACGIAAGIAAAALVIALLPGAPPDRHGEPAGGQGGEDECRPVHEKPVTAGVGEREISEDATAQAAGIAGPSPPSQASPMSEDEQTQNASTKRTNRTPSEGDMTHHEEEQERQEDIPEGEQESLQEEQEEKGYGADPGERERALEEETDDS